MYHPYFRGKQYELITIRENAGLMARSGFIPIVEPVKEVLSGLERTLKAVSDNDGRIVVVVNPQHGELAEDGADISELLRGKFGENQSIAPGFLLGTNATVDEAIQFCNEHHRIDPALIHCGFADGKLLAQRLGDGLPRVRHFFIAKHSGALYRRHFQNGERVIIADGFQKRRNRDYETVEKFSDIHITFRDEGMNGFGDFLIVGDDFAEGGGPAYAVAIHLTFINPDLDDQMFIYHFKSRRQDTPTDPAGKFAEALEQMIEALDRGDSHVMESRAVAEFRQLHADGHFPGLGYIKKLSMQHHIETLSQFLSD